MVNSGRISSHSIAMGRGTHQVVSEPYDPYVGKFGSPISSSSGHGVRQGSPEERRRPAEEPQYGWGSPQYGWGSSHHRSISIRLKRGTTTPAMEPPPPPAPPPPPPPASDSYGMSFATPSSFHVSPPMDQYTQLYANSTSPPSSQQHWQYLSPAPDPYGCPSSPSSSTWSRHHQSWQSSLPMCPQGQYPTSLQPYASSSSSTWSLQPSSTWNSSSSTCTWYQQSPQWQYPSSLLRPFSEQEVFDEMPMKGEALQHQSYADQSPYLQPYADPSSLTTYMKHLQQQYQDAPYVFDEMPVREEVPQQHPPVSYDCYPLTYADPSSFTTWNHQQQLQDHSNPYMFDKMPVRSGDKSDASVAASFSRSDLSKSSLHTQVPGSRPLVPSGFASTSMEKKLSLESSSISHTSEAGTTLVENDHSVNRVENDQDKNSSIACTQFKVEQNETKGVSALPVDANEKLVASISICKFLEQALDSGNVSGMAYSIQEAIEVWEDATISDDEVHGVSETQEIKEIEVQGPTTKAELVKPIGNSDESDVKEDWSRNVVKGNMVQGEAVEDLESEWLSTTPDVEYVNLTLEMSFLEADMLSVMKGIRELKLGGLILDSQAGVLSNLQARNVIAAQLAAGKQQEIAKNYTLGPRRKLAGVIEDLDVIATDAIGSVTDEQHYIAENENHGQQSKRLEVSCQMDVSVIQFDVSWIQKIELHSDGTIRYLLLNSAEIVNRDVYVSATHFEMFKPIMPQEWREVSYFQNLELVFAPAHEWISRSDSEIIDATMEELEKLFFDEKSAHQSKAKVMRLKGSTSLESIQLTKKVGGSRKDSFEGADFHVLVWDLGIKLLINGRRQYGRCHLGAT